MPVSSDTIITSASDISDNPIAALCLVPNFLLISLAINGRLTRNYDKDRLRTILLKIMEHREEKNVKTAGKKVKTWITGKINRK